MFKFNFGNENINSEKEEKRENEINWYECKKVEVRAELIDKLEYAREDEKGFIKLNYNGNITLTCLSSSYILNTLRKECGNTMSIILEADRNHSDLIPGKYEGGLKIWECTRDLVNYLSVDKMATISQKEVLDLGCGAGILGIIAAIKGASVTFQDYNHEVLELVTIPNVFLNVKNIDDVNIRTEFFSGDWSSFVDCMTQNGNHMGQEKVPSQKKLKRSHVKKFDYIFTSETIYNPDNYNKIYRVIKELLRNDGVCYVAAKKCYFGVGGNTLSFTEYLKKENVFEIEVCWSSDTGVSREILKISFRNRHV